MQNHEPESQSQREEALVQSLDALVARVDSIIAAKVGGRTPDARDRTAINNAKRLLNQRYGGRHELI